MSREGTKQDLLQYNAKYRVLICRECKYAIQKGALGSHLLRHKIYRGERKQLLCSVSRFELLEPDEVELPPGRSSPVDGLPILSGYRCNAPNCTNLCASSKRMRRHWSEVHGTPDPPKLFAHPANLQTFFRGTKIRYFEVSSTRTSTPKSSAADHQDLESSNGLDGKTALSVNLEALRYFHHFTTTTSLTLPVDGHEPRQYWQAVVENSLQLHWLMCGLLAISANHLASLSDDEPTKQTHLERSMSFFKEFSVGWADFRSDLNQSDPEKATIGAQIICIQRCCHWTSGSRALDSESTPELPNFRLQLFITTIQGCIDPDFALKAAFKDNDSEESFIRVGNDMRRGSHTGAPNNVPHVLEKCLRSIPYRMAEILSKPENPLDVFAALSAIDAMLECATISYASDNARVVWRGMESWLQRLSARFHRMIGHEDVAALIILAHWSLLVGRAERHFWFLQGSAKNMLRYILSEVSEDSAVQNLIQDSIGFNLS
jgi:hypothetical protein